MADISLRISEALTRDVGRGLVRVDPKEMSAIGVGTGDTVRLIGKRSTVAKALPAYAEAVAEEPGRAVIGGQSFGGRVASLLAAERAPAALVLIAYPLHAPGRHDAWVERTAHWPRIECPVLLLSGDADPFARVDLLRNAATQLPNHRLVIYPGVGHGVRPVLEAALDEIHRFIATNT